MNKQADLNCDKVIFYFCNFWIFLLFSKQFCQGNCRKVEFWRREMTALGNEHSKFLSLRESSWVYYYLNYLWDACKDEINSKGKSLKIFLFWRSFEKIFWLKFNYFEKIEGNYCDLGMSRTFCIPFYSSIFPHLIFIFLFLILDLSAHNFKQIIKLQEEQKVKGKWTYI